MVVKRAYKYRFYPTDQQVRTLAQTFGCVRFIYNFGLATRSTAYKEQGKKLSYHDLSALLPPLKEQFPWLKDVSSVPVQQSLRHLETAFQNFFESLAVKNMVKNHCLAKSISDVGWGEFVRQLEYKAAWYGRTLVKIDRWYPSSKRCFACGHVLETLDLSVREWTCPECHVLHDRDRNAANNILAEGLSVNACGERVRPARANAQTGNPRRNRKAQS